MNNLNNINDLEDLRAFLNDLGTNHKQYNKLAEYLLKQPVFEKRSKLYDKVWQMYKEWYFEKVKINPSPIDKHINRIVDLLQRNTSTEQDAIDSFNLILNNYPSKYKPQLYEFSYKIEYVVVDLKNSKKIKYGHTDKEIREYINCNY